ncbi:MAG: hypothetical protein ACE5OT_04880, partial [Candidatus Hadarchaeaceae archaeon]
IVIMMLVVAVLGHSAWSRYQRSLDVVDDVSSSALLTIAMGVQNDLQAAVRYAVYRALWEVSKNADDYESDGARELAIESLAAKYFAERTTALPNLYKQHDARIELEIPSGRPVFDLWEGNGGYAWVTARLPSQARVRVSSWDNSLVLEFLYENLEVFIDSRYFLLQRRMREFIDGLGSVGTKWAVMEYIAAWAGAWLQGKVTMSASRSKAFFELAWAAHELDIFGSADYVATVGGLIDTTAGTGETSEDILSELSNTTVVITPLKPADVKTMGKYVDRALEALAEASTALMGAKEHIRRGSDALTQTLENMDNISPALENVQAALGDAIGSITQARNHVSEADQRFEQLIDFTARSAGQNMTMGALHESLVERMRGDYPSPREQVAWGVRGTLAKLDNLETNIKAFAREVGADNTIAELEYLMTDLLNEITLSVQELLAEPAPKRWVEYTSYAEPGSYEGEPPESVREIAPVYIDGEGDGAIATLKIVLQNVRSNLDKMKRLAERAEPPLDEITSIEIDETLKQKLELIDRDFSSIDREQLYELLPPPPIQSQPGLSVLHNFNIKKVRYRREDPAGWFGSPTPTPIPLWFIGVTLWWAQWDITLELEGGAIEEIFDFDNPTLPLTHEAMSEKLIAHKPLAYRHEVSKNTFNVRLVIISLRPFGIS